MFTAMTHVPEYSIRVKLSQIIKYLLREKRSDVRSVLILNHFNELEYLRVVGFDSQARKNHKITFMPNEATKFDKHGDLLIINNINAILDALDELRRVRKIFFRIAFIIFPILVVLIALLMKRPFMLMILLFLVPAFGIFGTFYTVTLEKVAECYHIDGELRQVEKLIDRKHENPERYDLSKYLL